MQKRSKQLQVVLEEGQKWAVQLPLKRRASLYRGLAEVCGDSHDAALLIKLADECDALAMNEAKMQFKFLLEGDGN